MAKKESAEATVRNIRRKTRKKYGAEEKIRIVLEGLKGEGSIAELCRREGIAQSLYYKSPEGDKYGAKSSWKPENNACPGIPSARLTVKKSVG